jgi:hypothetical protein
MIKDRAHLDNGVTERATALGFPVYRLNKRVECWLGVNVDSAKQELLSMYRPCSANKRAIAEEIDVGIMFIVKISGLQNGQHDLERNARGGNARSWKIFMKFVRRGIRSKLK